MSAVPNIPNEFGYVGLRMSAAEFFALEQTTEHLQLVDGVVVMSPRPTPLHQTIVRLLLRQLEAWLDEHPDGSCFPEVDWELDNNRVYSPDIACYAPGRLARIPLRLTETPDLVIEILSPGTKSFDLTTKKDDYERAGVGEYWTIDTADARVRVYVLEDNVFIERAGGGGHISSSVLPGFALDTSPLRRVVADAGS